MKRCKVCGELKTLDEFYAAAGMRDGNRSDCKTCNNAAHATRYAANPQRNIERVKRWQQENSERLNAYRREYRQRPERKRADRNGHLRRKFGITIDDYERMLEEQGYGCAICGAPEPDGASLHVDHDHESGEVRGLLCFTCNNALGDVQDSLDRVL